jgi:putative nucleotidyltransferase with HDIG domain
MIELPGSLDRRITDAVDRMPAFPKSVQRVLELTRDIRCQPKDLVSVIEKDPVLTFRILKVLNSAYFGLPQKINSVNYAVVYLGFNTIKNLALSVATIGVLPKQSKDGLDIQLYLFHSLTSAAIARQLCARLGGGMDPMDCHIAGLLHDFGRVVFAQFMPIEFKAVQALHRDREFPMLLAEQQIIGIDHAAVGAMLAEKWRFPEPLVDCIRHHHDGDAEHTVASAVVYAANLISHELVLEGAAEDQDGDVNEDSAAMAPALYSREELPPVIAARCGGNLDEVAESLGDLSRIVEEAKLFSQVGAGK